MEIGEEKSDKKCEVFNGTCIFHLSNDRILTTDINDVYGCSLVNKGQRIIKRITFNSFLLR